MKHGEKILATLDDVHFWEFMNWAQTDATEQRFRGRDFSDLLYEWAIFEWLREQVNLN